MATGLSVLRPLGEGMLAGGEGERDAGAAFHVGSKYAVNHFEEHAAIIGATERLAIFAHGREAIAGGQKMIGDVRAHILERLRLSNSGGGDGDPRTCFRAGLEGIARDVMRKSGRVDADVDQSLVADELQPESGGAHAGALDGIEI